MALPIGESEATRRALEAELEARAEALRVRHGIDVEPLLRSGAPGRVIVEAAEELGVELVVLGTHGRSGLHHLVMGSTAERVVRRSSVPVLTVHAARGLAPGEPRCVLLPVDLISDPAPVVQTLLRVFGESARLCDLLLVHCERPPVQLQALGEELGLERLGLAAAGSECADSLERVAERLRREGFSVSASSCQGEPAELIPQIASARAVDLIAMETRGLTGLAHMILGSTAESVVQRAHCPVLTVHRTPARPRSQPAFAPLGTRALSAEWSRS
jgi:nucleotide-binding universal stress UspA family protein